MNPHCRISKVRWKDAPHLVEIFPKKRGIEYRQVMINHADEICGMIDDKGIAGFAMFAWNFDGYYAWSRRIHPESFVGTTLLPSFMQEVMRRSLAVDVARDVFNGKL